MKIKIGSLEIEGKTLRKMALPLFVPGVSIGLMVAAKQNGHTVSPALFVVVTVILIPALARHLFRHKSSGDR